MQQNDKIYHLFVGHAIAVDGVSLYLILNVIFCVLPIPMLRQLKDTQTPDIELILFGLQHGNVCLCLANTTTRLLS